MAFLPASFSAILTSAGGHAAALRVTSGNLLPTAIARFLTPCDYRDRTNERFLENNRREVGWNMAIGLMFEMAFIANHVCVYICNMEDIPFKTIDSSRA